MQKYFNKKSKSPFLNDKSPKIGNSSKDQSINNENITREQTIEKLILQLDLIRRKHEQEKREMTEAFNLQIQTKIKQFQILENEYQQKNQLLEQLLFQEQSKTIHLTRIFQDKQKSIPINEKDLQRNKFQQSEISQDSQRNNTKVQTKQTPKDNSVKMLLEIFNNIQANVVRHSKIKRLNISWIDYEILETDLQKQKDLSKSLAKINQIFDKFFNIINDNSAPQLSPYRVTNTPNQFYNIDKQVTSNKEQTKNKQFTQTTEISTKTHKYVQTTDLNNKLSKLIQKLRKSYLFYNIYISFINRQKYVQNKQIYLKPSIQTDTIEQNQNKEIQKLDKIINHKEIVQANQQSSTSQLIRYQNYAQQTESRDVKFEIYKTLQISLSNKINQVKVKQISTEVQTDHIDRESIIKQMKHNSKITEKDEEDEEEQNNVIKKQNLQGDKEIENDNESIFDCNKPDYDSVIEHHEELVDLRRECQEKSDKITNLEITIQQILKEQGLFQFDNLYMKFYQIYQFLFSIIITSDYNKKRIEYYLQHSLQELSSNKWLIKLKDHEAQQKQTIGILGLDLNLIKNTIKAIFNEEVQVNLGLHQFAIQYYDNEFLENYKLDIMIKQIQFPEKIIVNSKLNFEHQQFQKFWIDFMISHCNVFIYLCKICNEDDLRMIQYLKENNKKLIIITFTDFKNMIFECSDLQIENFYNYNNYKQNIDYQILKIQENKNILSSVCKEILQSDWDWVDVEDSLLVQLQSHIQNIIGNEDCIQLQIKEDGIFEISVINDELNYDSLLSFPYICIKQLQSKLKKLNYNNNIQIFILYIKSKEQQEDQIQLCLELWEFGQIQDVKCIETQILIVIDSYILLEQMDIKTQLHSIDDNKILLSKIK